MNSICLACLLYTLKDKEVKENLYIDIFYLWLAKVIQSGDLRSNDLLQITVDSRTVEYFNSNSSALPVLLEKIQCPYEIIEVDPPSTSLEGMMNKYNFTEYTQDVYIYCDIDIIISNSFHTLLPLLKNNTAYFCKEGSFSHDNYGESFNHGVSDDLPGLSAGKFIITDKLIRDSLFNIIRQACNYSTTFYTVEQPYFNYAIYSLPRDTISVNIDLLTEYVSFNGNEGYDKNKTIFNDMAGDPANGEVHLKKIIHMISLYLSGIY
jgi:hypothetical protein